MFAIKKMNDDRYHILIDPYQWSISNYFNWRSDAILTNEHVNNSFVIDIDA